jgi:membrane protein DedA with SNARE-associated domain
MFGVGMAGVLIGDLIMFMIGRLYGENALRLRWVAWLVTPARRELVQRKFDRYGIRLLFIARFLPGLRSPIFIIAGWSRRVSLLKFLLLDGAAALISVPFWVYLGYYGADNHEWLMHWVHRGKTGIWIGIGVLVVVVAILIWKHYRSDRVIPPGV